jgi:hypothetical protein
MNDSARQLDKYHPGGTPVRIILYLPIHKTLVHRNSPKAKKD